MNPVDRFQALIRHPDYRNDPRLALRSLLDLADHSALVAGLLNKESCERDFEHSQFLRVWGLEHAVDPANQEEIEKTLTDLRVGNVSIFTDDIRGFDSSPDRYNADPESGHFFTLRVDLEQPTTELLELISQMIDSERTARRIKTKRKKQHRVDPWVVWDKAKVAGGNLLQVTRLLFKVKGNPSYDEGTKRAYDQVQRAHRKAVSMIEELGRCRNKAPRKELAEYSTAIFSSMWSESLRSLETGQPPDLDSAVQRVSHLKPKDL